ncbi:hypothetical protein GCM10023148_56760 [Actinokineospora soli]
MWIVQFMVPRCAHHVADFAPVVGLSGAAVFPTDFRVPITAAGIAVNAIGVFLTARPDHLRRVLPSRARHPDRPAARLRVNSTGAAVELRITGLPVDAVASWGAP